MDAETILRIKPRLTQFLHEFDGCLGRVTHRRHLETYVAGQLRDLQRKSHALSREGIEPIADAGGVLALAHRTDVRGRQRRTGPGSL